MVSMFFQVPIHDIGKGTRLRQMVTSNMSVEFYCFCYQRWASIKKNKIFLRPKIIYIFDRPHVSTNRSSQFASVISQQGAGALNHSFIPHFTSLPTLPSLWKNGFTQPCNTEWCITWQSCPLSAKSQCNSTELRHLSLYGTSRQNFALCLVSVDLKADLPSSKYFFRQSATMSFIAGGYVGSKQLYPHHFTRRRIHFSTCFL